MQGLFAVTHRWRHWTLLHVVHEAEKQLYREFRWINIHFTVFPKDGTLEHEQSNEEHLCLFECLHPGGILTPRGLSASFGPVFRSSISYDFIQTDMCTCILKVQFRSALMIMISFLSSVMLLCLF